MSYVDRAGVAGQAELTELVYELLDAHADTLALVTQPGPVHEWGPHLEYLRDLQRVGREVLARVG